MKIYLTTTFSPSMLAVGCRAVITECKLSDVPASAESAVGHAVTAKVLSVLLGREVPFNRVNLLLRPGDEVYAVIPQFRAEEAREFTKEEVEDAGYRAFKVMIYK